MDTLERKLPHMSRNTFKHSRLIAGIAAKEWTRVLYNRDRNRYRFKFKKINASQKEKEKTVRGKSMNIIRSHCAEAFSLGTFITYINSFDLKLIQIKFAKVILLSEVSHV